MAFQSIATRQEERAYLLRRFQSDDVIRRFNQKLIDLYQIAPVRGLQDILGTVHVVIDEGFQRQVDEIKKDRDSYIRRCYPDLFE